MRIDRRKRCVVIFFFIISVSRVCTRAATPAQLLSWCNSVDEYWTLNDYFDDVGLPYCDTEEVCRVDIYEQWIRDCENLIEQYSKQECVQKLQNMLQGKYGPPKEIHMKRAMCDDDCTKYQSIMDEALRRTCCESNCTIAHPLGTEKACYENALKMSEEVLGVTKTMEEWDQLCNNAFSKRPRLLLSMFLIGLVSVVVANI